MRKYVIALLLVLFVGVSGVYAQEYSIENEEEWPLYSGDRALAEYVNIILSRTDISARMEYISKDDIRNLELGDKLIIGGTSIENAEMDSDDPEDPPFDARYVTIGDYDDQLLLFNSRVTAIATPLDKSSELTTHYSNHKTIFYYVEYVDNVGAGDEVVPFFIAHAWAPNILDEGTEFEWPEGFNLNKEDNEIEKKKVPEADTGVEA